MFKSFMYFKSVFGYFMFIILISNFLKQLHNIYYKHFYMSTLNIFNINMTHHLKNVKLTTSYILGGSCLGNIYIYNIFKNIYVACKFVETNKIILLFE
jgi:hypothetical protein